MEVEKWRRHFRRMAEGKSRPNHKGHWIVKEIQVGGQPEETILKLVTPVARDIELAKSELEEEKIKDKKGYKRELTAARKPPKKARFSKDVFTR